MPPTAQEISHIVAAAKQAAANVFLAQQQVSAAKEDVLVQQKLIKEKEAHALIAQQKSESAQHILRSEAQNVVFAQQKLAKVIGSIISMEFFYYQVYLIIFCDFQGKSHRS